MRQPKELQEDIEWLEGCVVIAEQYSQDIFDVVSTVKQVPMLEHNRNYITAIKAKIEALQADLKWAREYFNEDEGGDDV